MQRPFFVRKTDGMRPHSSGSRWGAPDIIYFLKVTTPSLITAVLWKSSALLAGRCP